MHHLPTNGIFAVGLGRDMLSRIDKTREVLGPLASTRQEHCFYKWRRMFRPHPTVILAQDESWLILNQ